MWVYRSLNWVLSESLVVITEPHRWGSFMPLLTRHEEHQSFINPNSTLCVPFWEGKFVAHSILFNIQAMITDSVLLRVLCHISVFPSHMLRLCSANEAYESCLWAVQILPVSIFILLSYYFSFFSVAVPMLNRYNFSLCFFFTEIFCARKCF